MKNITKAFVSCFFFLFACHANSETPLKLSGNYVYNNSDEKLVLSFKNDGVVLLRRYKRDTSAEGMKYKKMPTESIWAPYIVHANNEAKALVCENGNPFGKCTATTFSSAENEVDWGNTTFNKTELSYTKSRFDFGPYTFEKLAEIYKFKLSKIVPGKI